MYELNILLKLSASVLEFSACTSSWNHRALPSAGAAIAVLYVGIWGHPPVSLFGGGGGGGGGGTFKSTICISVPLSSHFSFSVGLIITKSVSIP